MLEAFAKNLWLLLTLVIPGLFTYGAWRAILFLQPNEKLALAASSQLEQSTLVTASVIVAIAVLQQTVAIVVEAALSLLAKMMEHKWPYFYALFCERFELTARGKLDENATRIIGGFFLSINISAGLGLLLLYFLTLGSTTHTEWIPRGLLAMLAVTLIAAVFRMLNAKWVVEGCMNGRSDVHVSWTFIR